MICFGFRASNLYLPYYFYFLPWTGNRHHRHRLFLLQSPQKQKQLQQHHGELPLVLRRRHRLPGGPQPVAGVPQPVAGVPRGRHLRGQDGGHRSHREGVRPESGPGGHNREATAAATSTWPSRWPSLRPKTPTWSVRLPPSAASPRTPTSSPCWPPRRWRATSWAWHEETLHTRLSSGPLPLKESAPLARSSP